jgi:hypothetical protein
MVGSMSDADDSRQIARRRQEELNRVINQLIDYQVIAILIDYFNYQFN